MSEIFQLYECGDIFQFTDPADSYQTWQGLQGPKGDPGEPGPPGQGLTISGTVATVGDLPASAEQGEIYLVGEETPYTAYVWNEGSWTSIGEITVGPQGPPGEDGQDGAAAGFGTPTATVDGNVGTPGVTITASGPDTAKVFAFAFTNLKGAQGNPGTPGQDGADGAAATIAVGTVSGLPAGSTPTVTNSGSISAAVFNFGIPAGAQGAPGQDGDDGAAAGFGTPTISIGSGTGTPSATVTASGPDTAKVFAFSFDNLKGATGATGQGVPAGGSAGQVLTKKTSGTDYDTEWTTPEAGGGALYKQNVAILATSGTIATVSDANITADFVVASIVFANPSAITSDVTWTTGAGSLTLTGTCTSATTADIILVKT